MDSIIISTIYCETRFLKSIPSLSLCLRCFLIMRKVAMYYVSFKKLKLANVILNSTMSKHKYEKIDFDESLENLHQSDKL